MFQENRKAKLLTLFAVCFALFMAMLDNMVVNVALPSISKDLGSGISGLQWIVDAYTLVFATLILTGGTVGDIYGRKKCFIAGLLVFTGGSLLCALTPSLSVLIAGRGIQGLGAALLMPASLAIVTNAFPDRREQTLAIGIWTAVSALGLAVGPVVGGALVDSFGWQSIFYMNVPIGVVALVVAWLAVGESGQREGRRLDLPGQVLAILAIGSLTYGFIEANTYGWGSPRIVSLFVIAVVGLAAFVFVEHRSTKPMINLAFFRRPTFTAGTICALAISFGMFGFSFFITLFFQNVQGYSPFRSGLRSLVCTLTFVFFTPLASKVAGRIGSRLPMSLGIAIFALGLFLFARVQIDTPYADIWPLLAILGFGMALVMAPMTVAVMSSVPAEHGGIASATTNASREVGGVLGVAVLGAIVTRIVSRDVGALLNTMKLPAEAKTSILAQVGGGNFSISSTDPRVSQYSDALSGPLKESFVSGMHLAFVVAGFVLLVGAASVAILAHKPSLEMQSLADEATPEEPEGERARVRS